MEGYSRSDLAYEAIKDVEGLSDKVYSEEKDGGVIISRLVISSEAEQEHFGKPAGSYVTVMFDRIWHADEGEIFHISSIVAREIRRMCEGLSKRRIDEGFRVLIVGLGNSEITSDAIGPKTVRKLNVTRHIRGLDKKLYDSVGMCEVSAISPGVLGQTGIESVEIVRGASENVSPHIIIAVDALAALSCSRLATTVQICDSGISPGSGMGNERKAISLENIGVPVIALGVPTVVNSSSLVYSALEQAGINEVSPELERVLENGRDFFVSPKESDVITDKTSRLLAEALNMAFTV